MRRHRIIFRKDGRYCPQYKDAWYPWSSYRASGSVRYTFTTKKQATNFILEKIERERVAALLPEVVWHD